MYVADTSALGRTVFPNVVLVFEASQCLSCSVNIGTWIELRRRNPGKVRLLLTSMPDSASAIVLARARVPVDGVISSGGGLSARPPYALVADGAEAPPHVVSVERWTAAALAPALSSNLSPLAVTKQ